MIDNMTTPVAGQENPFILWEGKTKHTTTEYDYDAAEQARQQAQQNSLNDFMQSIALPEQKSNRDYLKAIDNLYARYNPPKAPQAQQDARLAGIQSLATAVNDLGRAVGKSVGNSKGLGMVKVDSDANFQNKQEQARLARAKAVEAQNADNLMQLNRQLEALKSAKSLDSDLRKRAWEYADKKGETAYNRELQKSKKETTTEVWDKNSQSYKEHQAEQQRKRESHNSSMAESRLRRQKLQKQIDDAEDEDMLPNPAYNADDTQRDLFFNNTPNNDNEKVMKMAPNFGKVSDQKIGKMYAMLIGDIKDVYKEYSGTETFNPATTRKGQLSHLRMLSNSIASRTNKEGTERFKNYYKALKTIGVLK